jgi:hypothetical protein
VLLKLSEEEVYGEEFGITSGVAKKRLMAAIEELKAVNVEASKPRSASDLGTMAPSGTIYDLGLDGFR